MSLPRGRRVSVRVDETYDFVRPPASTSPSASLGVDSHHGGDAGVIDSNTPGGLCGAGSTSNCVSGPVIADPVSDGTIAVALPIANLPRTPASPPAVPALASTSTISSSMVIPPVALSIERPRASLDVSGMMAVVSGGGSSPSTSLLAPSHSFGGLVPSPSMNARGTVTFGGVPVPNTTGPDGLQMKSPPVKKYKTPEQVYPLLVHGSSPINESFLREVVVLLRRRGEDGPAPLALERWCGTDMTTLPDVRAAELAATKSTNFYAAPTTPWAQPSVHVQAPGPIAPAGANRSATTTPIPNSAATPRTATPRTATPSARSSSLAGGASQNARRDEKSGGTGAGAGGGDGKRGSVTGVAAEASLAHESTLGNENARNGHELHQGGPEVLPPVMMLLLHLQPKVIGGMVGIRLSDLIGVSSHYGGGSAQPGGSLSPGALSALSPGEVSLPAGSGVLPSEAPFNLQGVGSDCESSQQKVGAVGVTAGGGGGSHETAVRSFALPAEPDHASVVQRSTPPKTQGEPPLERQDTASFDPAPSHQLSASSTSAAKVASAKANDSAPHFSLKDAARDVIVQRANEHVQEMVQQQHHHAHSSDGTDVANDLPHGIISHMSEVPPQRSADHQHHLPTSSSLPGDGTHANAANAAPGNTALQWSGATPTPTESLGSLHGGSALMSLGRSQLTTNAGLSHLGTSSLSTSGAKTSAGAGNSSAGANVAGGGFSSLAATASALVARQRAKTHDDARRAREYRRSFQFLFDGAPFVTKQAKDLRCRVLVDSAGVVKDEQTAIIPPTDRRKADRRRHQRSTTSAPGDLPSGSHRRDNRDNRSSRSQSEFQQRANQRSSSSVVAKNPSGLIDSDAESPLSPKSPLSMASPKSPQSPRSRINFDFSGPTESGGTFSYTGGAANVVANGGAMRGDDAANEMTTTSHDKESEKEEEPARAPVYVDVVCAGTVGSLYAPQRRLEVWVGAGSGDADSAQTSTGSFPKSSQQAKPIAQRFLNSNSPKPPQAPLASALPTPVSPAVVGPPGISFTSTNQNQNNDSRNSFESDEKGSSKERDAGKREKGRKGGSSSVASRRMKQRLTRGDSLLDDSFEGLSPQSPPLSMSKRRQTATFRDSRRSTVSASPPGNPRRKTLAGSLSQSTPIQPPPKPPASTNTAGPTAVPDIVLTQQSSTNVDGSPTEATRARMSERKRSVSPCHRGSLNPLANPGGSTNLGGSTRRLSNSSQTSGAGYDSPPSTPKPVPLAPSWLVNGMLPSMLSPHIDVSATTNSNATMMHGKTIPTATTPTTRVSIDDRSSFDGECSARSFALDDAQPTPTNSAGLARNSGGAFGGGSANLGHSASQHRRLSLSEMSHESSSVTGASASDQLRPPPSSGAAGSPAAAPVALMATAGESEGRKGRGRRGSQVLFVSPPPRRPSPQSTSALATTSQSLVNDDDDDDDLDVGFESKQCGSSSVNAKKKNAGGKPSSVPESGPATSGSEFGGRSDSEKSESGGANIAHGAGPDCDPAEVLKSDSGAVETSSTVVAVAEGTKIIRLRVTDFEPIGSETGCEWFLQTFQQLDDVDPNDRPFSSETATASGPVLLRAVNRRAIREEEARIQRQHQIAHARSTPNLPHSLEKSARKVTDGSSASGKKAESFVPKRVGSSENAQRVHNESRREDNAPTTTSISAQLHAMSNEIILNKYLGTKAPPLSGAGGGQSTLSGDWSMSGVGGGVGGGGVVATTSNARLPLQTEEYLQFTNPELFDWCLGQSAVSMTTSIEAIASAMKAFRYSSAFSRTVKRIRISVRRIQRFFRAIVTRRRGAVALALLAWRNNEHTFVQHLERLKVLCEKDSTGIHMVVNNALRDNAVVTETAKRKEIVTVWRERKATWRAKFQEVSEEIEAWVANRNFSVFGGDGDRRGTEFYQPEGAESSNFHRHAVMHSSPSVSVLSRTPSTSTRAEDSFCIEGSMTVEGREFEHYGADGEHDGESSTLRHNGRENGRSSRHVITGGGGGVGGRSSTNARGSNRSASHSTIGSPKSASALQQAIRRRTAFDALDPREFTQLMSGVRFSFLISKEELHQRAERTIRAVVLGPGPAGIYQHPVLQVLTTYEYTPQEAAMRHLRILLSEKRNAEESVKVQRGFRGTTGRDAQAAMPASLTSPSVRGTKTSEDPSDGPRAGKYERGSPSGGGGGGGLSAMSSNKKASPSPRRGPQRSAQPLGPSTSKGSSKAPGSLSGGGADEDTGELLTASTAMNLFIPVPHATSVLALKHRTVLELHPAKTSPGPAPKLAPKTAPTKPSKEVSSPSAKSATMHSLSLSQQPSKEFKKNGDKQEAEVNVVESVAPSVEPSPVKSFVLATAPQSVPGRTSARRDRGIDDDDEQDPPVSTPTSRSDKNTAAGAVSPDTVVAQFAESSPTSKHPSVPGAVTAIPSRSSNKASSAAVSSVGKGVSTASKAKVKESATTAESEKSKDFRIAEASLPAGVRLETQLAFLSPPSKKKTAQHDGADIAFAQTVGGQGRSAGHGQFSQPHSPARSAQAVGARSGLGPFEPPRRVLTKPPQSHTHHGPSPSRSSVASPRSEPMSKTPNVTTNESRLGDSSSQTRSAKHGGDGGVSASGPAGYQPSTLTSAKETQRTYHSTVEFAQALLGQPSSSQLSPRRDLAAQVPGSMLGTTSPSKIGLLAKSPRRLKSIGDGANGGQSPQQPTAALSLLETHRREMNPTAQRTQAFMNSRRTEAEMETDHHASNDHYDGDGAVVMNPSKSTTHARVVESGDGGLDGGENGGLDERVDPERRKHIPATAGSSKQLRGPHGAALPGAAYVEKMLADHTAHGGDPFAGHALASLPKVITCDTPPEDVEVYPFGNRTAHRVADRETAQLHRQPGQPSSSSPEKVTQVKKNPTLLKSVKSTASTSRTEVSPGQTAKQLFTTPVARRAAVNEGGNDTAQEELGIDVLRPSTERPPEELVEEKSGPPSPTPQFIDRTELEQEILVDYDTSRSLHKDASVEEQPTSKTEVKSPDDEVTPSIHDEQTEKEEATTSMSPPPMRKTNATPSSPAPPPSGFAAFGLGAIERIFKRSEALNAARDAGPAAGVMNPNPPPHVLSPQTVGGPPPGQGSPATGDHALTSPASESISGFVSASVLAAAIPTALVKSSDGPEASDDVHSPTAVARDDTAGAPAGSVEFDNSGGAPPAQSAGQLSLQSSPPDVHVAEIDPVSLRGDRSSQIPQQPPQPHLNSHHHQKQQQAAQPQVDAAQWRATKRQREKDHVVALAAALAGTGVVHPASTFPTAPKPGAFSLEALLEVKERRQHRAKMAGDDRVDDRDDFQSSARSGRQQHHHQQQQRQEATIEKEHQQQSKQQQKARGSTVGPFPPIAQTARGPEFIAASQPQAPSGPQTHRGHRGTTVGRGVGGGALGLGGVLGGLKQSPQKAQTARPHYTVKLPQLPPHA